MFVCISSFPETPSLALLPTYIREHTLKYCEEARTSIYVSGEITSDYPEQAQTDTFFEEKAH